MSAVRESTTCSAVSAVAEATIGRQVVCALVAAIELAGVPREDFLRRIGLREKDLRSTGERVPLPVVLAYCRQALEASGDPALGLHWGAFRDDRDFGPLSVLLAHASSLRVGLEQIGQFERLLHDAPSFEVQETASTVQIRVTGSAVHTGTMGRFCTEVLLAGMLTTVRRFAPPACPLAAHFAYAAPAYAAEYERVFATTVRFDRPASELIFERSLLDVPSPRGDRDTHAALRAVAEQRLSSLMQDASCAARLRRSLLARFPERATMPSLARELGLSTRTLRRRLAAEGTSYREVEATALASAAKRMLGDEVLAISETADRLGFSEPATFHRAFKSWTGVTPHQFRQDALAKRADIVAERRGSRLSR